MEALKESHTKQAVLIGIDGNNSNVDAAFIVIYQNPCWPKNKVYVSVMRMMQKNGMGFGEREREYWEMNGWLAKILSFFRRMTLSSCSYLLTKSCEHDWCAQTKHG